MAAGFFLLAGSVFDEKPPVRARHVVVIGVDGMSPNGIQNAETPFMDAMRKNGSWAFHAQAILPSSSSPNWASMIMGAGPEKHGITSNAWQRRKHEQEPVCQGKWGTFPTIFALLREQRPKAFSAIYHDWFSFGRLVEPGVTSRKLNTAGYRETTRAACIGIRLHKPELTFIHLDLCDHAGHKFGHGTPEYYRSVALADKMIGKILKALQQAKILEETVVLVTSDHGGIGKGHGGETMEEVEIPWIISGPGVKKDHEITTPFKTYHTAATLAWLLGVTPHECWDGKPVLEAFNE